MKCKDCKNYQKTQIMEYDLRPYIGKGYTLNEIMELSSKDEPKPLYDCPYANDWCEEDTDINTLCNNKFELKKEVE